MHVGLAGLPTILKITSHSQQCCPSPKCCHDRPVPGHLPLNTHLKSLRPLNDNSYNLQKLAFCISAIGSIFFSLANSMINILCHNNFTHFGERSQHPDKFFSFSLGQMAEMGHARHTEHTETLWYMLYEASESPWICLPSCTNAR